MRNSLNFFVVIEGIDGSGKSSVARQVVKVLQDKFKDNVKLTFEPHDPSCAGVFIRQVLMKRIRHVPLSTLALAFAVNRSDHCDREINPFLEKTNGLPRVVICDRYYLSSLVYQSDQNISFTDVMNLNCNARRPDLTIFLNASNKRCYERMRKRQEDKELFETRLNDTKAKYSQAIEFLRSKGDNIIEVNADGNFAEVTHSVLRALDMHSPPWFTIESYPLPLEEEENLFEPKPISIDIIAKEFITTWDYTPLINKNQLLDLLNDQQQIIKNKLVEFDFSNKATLFFEVLKSTGYKVKNKIPWTDIDAFVVEYEMPLGITHHGAALLLDNSQRYDIIFRKLLGAEKVAALDQMSDFLFIFDSNPSHLIGSHYERDMINYTESTSLSPSVFVIDLVLISDVIFSKVLEQFGDFYLQTLMGMPSLREAYSDYKKEHNLKLNLNK